MGHCYGVWRQTLSRAVLTPEYNNVVTLTCPSTQLYPHWTLYSTSAVTALLLLYFPSCESLHYLLYRTQTSSVSSIWLRLDGPGWGLPLRVWLWRGKCIGADPKVTQWRKKGGCPSVPPTVRCQLSQLCGLWLHLEAERCVSHSGLCSNQHLATTTCQEEKKVLSHDMVFFWPVGETCFGKQPKRS